MRVTVLALLSWGFMASCSPPSPEIDLDPEDRLSIARRHYHKGEYSDAITEYEKLVFDYRAAAVADSAALELANCYIGLKDYVLAVTELEHVVNRFPSSPLVPEADFLIGYCYWKQSPRYDLDQGLTYQGLSRLERFVESYPYHPRVTEAREIIAELADKLARKAFEAGLLYMRLKSYPSARIYFRAVLTEHGDTEWAPRARYELAESFYRQGELTGALEELDSFLEDYPEHELSSAARERRTRIQKELPSGENE